MLRVVAHLAAAVGMVTINPPPPTAPATVILPPSGSSLASGGSKQFHIYGRTSAGDSAAIAVAFSATGGSITSAGLYTAGATAGSYTVIASSSGLADTAVVTLTQALSSRGGGDGRGAVGIPFGPWAGARGPTSWIGGMEPFTATMGSTTPANIVTQIARARAVRRHLVINMTGGSHNRYLTNGIFDVAKWRAVIDGYDSPGIKRAIAEAVADGTMVGNSVMDEPNVHGLGDGNTWGHRAP